jgi:hypothetical protein
MHTLVRPSALLVVVSLLSVGCNDPSPGTCNDPGMGFCVTYVSGRSAGQAVAHCSGLGGTYSGDACPSANRVGRCTTTTGALTVTESRYAPYDTTASFEMQCANWNTAGTSTSFQAN